MGNQRYLTVNTNKYKKKRKEKEKKTYFRPAICGKLWRNERNEVSDKPQNQPLIM